MSAVQKQAICLALPSLLGGEGAPKGRMRGRTDLASRRYGPHVIGRVRANPHPSHAYGATHLLPQGEKEGAQRVTQTRLDP